MFFDALRLSVDALLDFPTLDRFCCFFAATGLDGPAAWVSFSSSEGGREDSADDAGDGLRCGFFALEDPVEEVAAMMAFLDDDDADDLPMPRGLEGVVIGLDRVHVMRKKWVVSCSDRKKGVLGDHCAMSATAADGAVS